MFEIVKTRTGPERWYPRAPTNVARTLMRHSSYLRYVGFITLVCTVALIGIGGFPGPVSHRINDLVVESAPVLTSTGSL